MQQGSRRDGQAMIVDRGRMGHRPHRSLEKNPAALRACCLALVCCGAQQEQPRHERCEGAACPTFRRCLHLLHASQCKTGD